MYTSADVGPLRVEDAEGFGAEGSAWSSAEGLGLNVRDAGAVPAGRVCAENSGAASAALEMTPGLCPCVVNGSEG